MSWIILFIAGVFEVGWTIGLKYAHGFTKLGPSLATIASMAVSLGTTYPDLTVICGRLESDPQDANTATNPLLIVEVLSDSTAAYDRGEKLAHYQRLPSLREVLFVAHDQQQLELWRREPDDFWSLHVARGQDTLTLASIAAGIPVPAVYASPF